MTKRRNKKSKRTTQTNANQFDTNGSSTNGSANFNVNDKLIDNNDKDDMKTETSILINQSATNTKSRKKRNHRAKKSTPNIANQIASTNGGYTGNDASYDKNDEEHFENNVNIDVSESNDTIMDTIPNISSTRPRTIIKEVSDTFKRYSGGSEYDEICTPSIEYNVINEKVDEECSSDNIQDVYNSENCDDEDIKIAELERIDNQDYKTHALCNGDVEEETKSSNDFTKNMNEKVLDKENDNELEENEIVRNSKDSQILEAVVQNFLCHDVDDMNDPILCNENNETVINKLDSDVVQEIANCQKPEICRDEIIYTEDIREDFLEYKAVESIQWKNESSSNSFKMTIFKSPDFTGSQNSITNVTSRSDENEQKSPKSKAKSKNFVKKIWKKIRSRKEKTNDNISESSIKKENNEEFQKSLSGSVCSSISMDEDNGESNSNQAVKSLGVSIDPTIIRSDEISEIGESDNEALVVKEVAAVEETVENRNEVTPTHETGIDNQLEANNIILDEPCENVVLVELEQHPCYESTYEEFDKLLESFQQDLEKYNIEPEKVTSQNNTFESDEQASIMSRNYNKNIIKYSNDDYLFPDALTPTKIISFDPPESYDVPFIDDFDDNEPFLGETKRFNDFGKFLAPLASLESLIIPEPAGTRLKKPITPLTSFRAKKPLSNFLGCMARSR